MPGLPSCKRKNNSVYFYRKLSKTLFGVGLLLGSILTNF